MLKLICSSLLLCVASTLIAQTDSTKKKILISSKGDTIDISKDADTMIFQKVEIDSKFPGGIEAWRSFLNRHLRYPQKALKDRVEGIVVVQFIVCTDGTVCNIEAISGPEILRKAAVDAFKKTPNWSPAVQKGKLVKSYKKQPLYFHLNRE